MPRRRVVVLTAAGLLLGVLCVVVGLAAIATQTQPGRDVLRRALLPTLDAALPGQVWLGRIGGNLVTEITLDSVELRQPDGTLFLASGPLRVAYDPRDLLARRIVLRRVTVTRPDVRFIDYGNDDWSHKRVFSRGAPRTPSPPRTTRGLGDWIRIDSAEILEGRLAVVQEWRPDDSLRGARRDSAIRVNLARRDSEIRRAPERLERTRRWERLTAFVGPSRVADPDTAGVRFQVRKLDVVELDPPFWFRDFAGVVRVLGDSLFVDSARIRLANSVGTGEAKIVWGGGLPQRWDIRVHGDTVAFADVAWIDETLPWEGGGETDFRLLSDPVNPRITRYILRNMDARALRSRLRGDMTFVGGEPVLGVRDVDLALEPLHTDLLRWMNGEPFPYDWQGAITGRVRARGGPVTRFVVDEAEVTYADAHVPGARTTGTIRGPLNVLEPALAKFLGTELEIARLDLRTPRYVNPLFPELNGVARGRLLLDSVWTDVRFRDARLVHEDGEGQPSVLAGRGRITLLDTMTVFDVDLTASPLNYTMLGRSYPTVPLHGLAVGPIRARGSAEDFALSLLLAGAGGEIAFEGRADSFDPSVAATGALRVTGGDLRELLADTALPPTSLGLTADVDLRFSTLADLTGSLRAQLTERSSRVGGVPVYAGAVRAHMGDGRLVLDSLAIESAAFRADASGALGLVAAVRDTLRLRLTADSLGGVRRLGELGGLQGLGALATLFPPPPDSGPAPRLVGTLALQATIAGSLDTLDADGVYVRADADAYGLGIGGTEASRATLAAELADVGRATRGRVTVRLDSARLLGLAAEAATAEATIERGVAERFVASARTPAGATVSVTGRAARGAAGTPANDTLRVRLDSVAVRVPDDVAGARDAASVVAASLRYALVAPASFDVERDGGVHLDSLVLAGPAGRYVNASASLDGDGTAGGSFVMRGVQLSDIAALARPGAPWAGVLDARGTLDGRIEAPRIALGGTLREARIGPVRFDRLALDGRYADRRLDADASLVVGDRPPLGVRLSVPVDLALEPRPRRLLDAPLDGRLTSETLDLATVSALVPSLEDGEGRMATDVRITGTWDRPRLDGRVALDGGAVTVAPLGVRFDRLRADVRLAGDTVLVERLAARSATGNRGTLDVSGRIGLADLADPTFDLRLVADGLQALDRARIGSVVATTTRPVTFRGSRRASVLDGALRVDEGAVYIRDLSQRRGLDLADDFGLVDTTNLRVDALIPEAPASFVQGVRLDDVRLLIGEDVWLRSPEANLKLGGALRLERALDPRSGEAALALADSLIVERGTYQLNLGIARPTFEVERGRIRFFGDPDVDPTLDVEALHVVRQQRANTNRQDVRIRVRIGGTVNRPTLTLVSADNPPVPESDMLSYLVTGEPAFALFGTPYAEQGATLALRLASSYLSSRLAGGRFDVVQVEPTALAPGEARNLAESGLGILAATRVGIGGQVGRGTYLSVSTGLCGLAPQGAGSGDALSLFAQGLGVKLERQFERGLSVSLGLEPASSAQACGRLGGSRAFVQTPPQIGVDLFRSWSF